jgi:hypothetical protein
VPGPRRSATGQRMCYSSPRSSGSVAATYSPACGGAPLLATGCLAWFAYRWGASAQRRRHGTHLLQRCDARTVLPGVGVGATAPAQRYCSHDLGCATMPL